MFVKKKVISLLLTVAVGIGALSFPVYAEEKGFATRQYVVSEFVQSVGRNTFETDEFALAQFKDSSNIDIAYLEDMKKAISKGIIRGYEDNTLKPRESIQRIEALAILRRCLPDINGTEKEQDFPDVPDWAKDDIKFLTKAGLVIGYGDGTLGAEDYITIEQVKLLTDRADELLNPDTVGSSFYGYINNKAQRNIELDEMATVDTIHNVIIPGNTSWSYFLEFSKNIYAKENIALGELVSGKMKFEQNTPEQRVYDMLRCIDEKDKVNDSDKAVVKKYRDMIYNAKSLSGLLDAVITIYNETGINVLFDIEAELDPSDHKVYPKVDYAVYAAGGLLQYQRAEDIDALKNMYSEYIREYLSVCGYDFDAAEISSAIDVQAKTAFKENYPENIDTFLQIKMLLDDSYTEDDYARELNAVHALRPDLYSEHSGYTDTSKWTQIVNKKEAASAFGNLDVLKMMNKSGFDSEKYIIPQKNVLDSEKDIWTEKNLEALKINALIRMSENLNLPLNPQEYKAKSLVDLMGIDFFSILSFDEIKEDMKDNEETDETNFMPEFIPYTDEEDQTILRPENLNRLRMLLPYDVGMIYCNHYYSDDTSEVAADVVRHLWAAFNKRFDENTWMSDKAKETAKKKSDEMVGVLGYPDNYEFPEITSPENGGTYFTNTMSIMRDEKNTKERQCSEDDFVREMMYDAPDTVNTEFIHILNIENVYAGILQSPICDKDASFASNLGAIGAVIGHEMAHAFDDNGSKYDETGCEKSWWTENDAKEYEKIKQRFIDYYNNFDSDSDETDYAYFIDENMADFAAMRCVMDLLDGDLDAQKEALEAYARMWLVYGDENYTSSSGYLMDTHTSPRLRVDAVVASLDEFYEIYDVKKGDRMYKEPSERLKLW